MIIKSMARKAPTFAQLIAYIGRDADPAPGTTFARNLYHSGADERVVAGQFLDNFRHLPKRKNGNALYHEVIVLEGQPHLDRAQLNAALTDLAERYCARRAPGQLAWGKIHHDTDHPHIHLMISANEVRSARRVRLDKAAFAEIQRDLERYKLQAHPELAGGPIYDRAAERSSPKITRNEGEVVRRTGKSSRKQAAHAEFQKVLASAYGHAEIVTRLRDAGFELYRRGKTTGVRSLDGAQKYRLSTLGLQAEFDAALTRVRPVPAVDAIPERKAEKPPERPKKPAPQRTIEQLKKPPPQKPRLEPDPRAAALLQRRADLERRAEDRLRGFDPDHHEDHDR